MENDIVRMLFLRRQRQKKRWKIKTISGAPPLTYKAVAGTLKDYKIYGNTISGESVGDLETTGEHAGEYKVPVTVEGKNLLPNTVTSQTINGVTFMVNSDGSVTCNGTASTNTYFDLSENFNSTLYAGMKASFYQIGQQSSINTFRVRMSKADRVSLQDFAMNNQLISDKGDSLLLAIRINRGYTCDNLTFYPMIRKADIEDDTYEPYQTPIDTNIYLPEQIRKVGEEAEYIDYGEQKQHRVRKNLFDEKYENIPEKLPIYEPIYVGDGYFTLSTTAPLNANSAANLFIMSGDVQTGASTVTTGVWSGHKGTVESVNGYITVAYRYQYGVDPRNYNTMLNAGSTVLPYEPYIENTDLDVALPALPTVAGTNVLTIGTEVQPSDVYIKGKIKKGE